MSTNCNNCMKSAYATDDQNIPAEVQEIVLKNYPNPFTGKTDIVFILPDDNHIYLDIFDISGKFVERLFSGEVKLNQEYKFEFTGTGLAPGTFIYKLTTKDNVLTRKMIYMND